MTSQSSEHNATATSGSFPGFPQELSVAAPSGVQIQENIHDADSAYFVKYKDFC